MGTGEQLVKEYNDWREKCRNAEKNISTAYRRWHEIQRNDGTNVEQTGLLNDVDILLKEHGECLAKLQEISNKIRVFNSELRND